MMLLAKPADAPTDRSSAALLSHGSIVESDTGIDVCSVIVETPPDDEDESLESPHSSILRSGGPGRGSYGRAGRGGRGRERRGERVRGGRQWSSEIGDKSDRSRAATMRNTGEQSHMRAPHVSTVYDKQDVMTKFFGVTPEQALRTQALLRLGVTEEDVKVAERLMAERVVGDHAHTKVEWLLGYTHAQMSYHKALEVLGVSEGVVEEERARRLGELGLGSWGSTASSYGLEHEGDDLCGGFFAKRRRSGSPDRSSLGTTLPGDVAFASTHTRVLELEEMCHAQMNRIHQLESQLAALNARCSSE